MYTTNCLLHRLQMCHLTSAKCMSSRYRTTVAYSPICDMHCGDREQKNFWGLCGGDEERLNPWGSRQPEPLLSLLPGDRRTSSRCLCRRSCCRVERRQCPRESNSCPGVA